MRTLPFVPAEMLERIYAPAMQSWRISALNGRHATYAAFPSDWSAADVRAAAYWGDSKFFPYPFYARTLCEPANALGPLPSFERSN